MLKYNAMWTFRYLEGRGMMTLKPSKRRVAEELIEKIKTVQHQGFPCCCYRRRRRRRLCCFGRRQTDSIYYNNLNSSANALQSSYSTHRLLTILK
ncbi:hypothetical protein PV328_003199, partial [Microctonus aethiopoides]